VVAKELARHLRANNFEKWLLEESLRALAAGANLRLTTLAAGQYSLSLSSSLDFEIVDHHAADERRPVKSLSGGETFLVSLALALALSEEVASMSASGASRLEAIFLDEGFGSLDPESLDIVGSVIAEIGASGKMVGIVTHVRELAEEVPVRFEISKATAGATVRKIEE
jgi:exonuclease SbcC